MSDKEYYLKIACNGETWLEGYIEDLQELGPGMVRAYSELLNGYVQLEIRREEKPGDDV